MEPTTPLTVTLQIQQWEGVLQNLANGPYRVVAPLMAAIQQQCQAAAESQPNLAPGRGNGMLDGKERAYP